MNAQSRYDQLTGYRSQFLDTAIQCSELTLPYLIQRDETRVSHKKLSVPWQAAGSKAVVTLASKLMLALLPPQTTFSSCRFVTTSWGKNSQLKCDLNLT